MDDREVRRVETVETEGPVTARDEVPGSIVAQRIVYFIVGFITTVLALRIVLLLLAANRDNAFVDFLYSFSAVFAWPFFGIFSYQPAYGQSTFEISSLVAIAIYGLIGWGIAKLLTINKARTAA